MQLESVTATNPSLTGVTRPQHLFLLSARSEMGLERISRQLVAFLEVNPGLDPAALAFTLQGLKPHPYRRAWVASTTAEARELLLAGDPEQVFTQVAPAAAPPVIFMFPGHGSQYVNMGRQLYETEPAFREALQQCAAAAIRQTDLNPLDILYPQSGSNGNPFAKWGSTQATLMAVEYAMGRLWQSWGVHPTAMIGHSSGEYAAACLAGVWTLDEVYRLLQERRYLMQTLPTGAMLSVSLAPDEVRRRIAGQKLSLATINSPNLCVVAGDEAAIISLADQLQQEEVPSRRLHINQGYHSFIVDPILDAYAAAVSRIALRPPQIPYISNVTGTWIRDDQATDPAYFAAHMRQTAHFAAGLAQVHRTYPDAIFLEVGPGNMLSHLARQQGTQLAEQIILTSMRHPYETEPDTTFLLKAAGQLWLAGVNLDWDACHAHAPQPSLALPDDFLAERAATESTPVLSMTERHRLLVTWNETAVAYPLDTCVSELIAAHAAATPQALAVVFRGQQLTYYQLNQQANQLAHYLRSLGVGPEVPVAVCLPRSPEMIVALLAILKAGGAYVPVNPDYPLERLAFILNDTQAPVLITRQESAAALPPYTGHVMTWETVEASLAAAPDTNPAPLTAPHNLAYIIYTSGSTGMPKGVQIEHRSLLNLLFYAIQTSALQVQDRTTHLAGVAFDAAVWEIWPALAAGASLHIPDEDIRFSPQQLRDWLIAQAITVAFVPTPLAEMIIALEWPTQIALRLLHTGGEALHDYPPATLPFALVNNYGPTENTVITTNVTLSPEKSSLVPPIGRPLPNVQVYILDDHLEPVPVGITGELYTSGAGLARGYLNRSRLTAQAFIPHPFCQEPGARLYRTGDLARYLPDGQIAFVGRRDDQVKIRGFRIELGEIEATLNQHTALQDAVVLAHEITPQDKRLVAYVVTRPQTPTTDDLRHFLQAHLPPYMIPSAYLFLEMMPFTPHGKVDRQALRALEITWAEQEADFVAPVGELENRLADIWSELLGLNRVGRHDNFFKLGGNSLMATQFLSRLRQTLQVELPFQALFQATTVAKMAAIIAARDQQSARAAEPPLHSVAREQQLPTSFAQQRLWFLAQLNPGDVSYNVTATIRLKGPLQIHLLQQSLGEIQRRHEGLRTTFAAVDGRPIQVITAAAPPPSLPHIDLRGLEEDEQRAAVRGRVRAEASTPFNLAAGPLWRLQLLQLADDEHILLLNMHHIISDGWSVNLLGEELAQIYGALRQGEPSSLPDLVLQYADFAHWQRQWLQGERLERLLTYWKQQLAGAPALLDLPTDRLRPRVDTFRGQHVTFTFPAPLTEALKAITQAEEATLFMTLLAAFQYLLYRYSHQRDFLLGSPIAGRNRPEIEPIIGFFVNTLVLRADLSGQPSFRELLARVREMTLAAYEHQDLPFDRLIEVVNPERDPSHALLFQVMFVLQNATQLQLPTYSDVTMSLLPQATAATRFDLLVGFVEDAAQLHGSIEYNTDLFDTATITRLAIHYQRLLEAIVVQPDRPLSKISFLTPEELRDWLTWSHSVLTQHSALSTQLLYLLDENLQPVPVGVPGEICWGEPDTETAIMADPATYFASVALHHTGEIARYRPDGTLEHLGRMGEQIVVLGGRRIWLTRIEALLAAHPGVNAAAVTANDSSRLIAYVVFNSPASPQAVDDLRRTLNDTLPQYMRLTTLIPVPLIPRTTTDKPDFQALALAAQQALAGTHPAMNDLQSSPEQETEQRRTELAVRQDQLSEKKRALLAKAKQGLLKNRTAIGAAAVPAIPQRPDPTEYPLSFAQQRMWFIEQLTPGVAANNIPGAIRLQGELNIPALAQALTTIVQRHEVLRATFKVVDGKPVQGITPPRPVQLEIIEVEGNAAAARETHARRLVLEKGVILFDLATGPLYQFTLLRLDTYDHILITVLHHIIADGWSMSVLTRELNALYLAALTSQPAALPELPIQYSDFAHAQRQWLQGEMLQRQVSYWKQQIGDHPPLVELPTDRPRPAIQTFTGEEMVWNLPQELVTGLLQRGQQEHVTPFMTFLAAFKAILHHYTGQTDLLIGSPIANRTQTEVENLIGFFVNTLVLRTDLSGVPTFRELLGRVRQTTLDAYAHQDLPFEKLVTELHLKRNLSHTPLFQIMFILENLAGQSRLELPGLTLSNFEAGTTTSKFDLTVLVQERPQGWMIRTHHNSDLFDRATIDTLMQRWQILMAGLIAHPDRPIADLSWLTAQDQQQLAAWNNTQRPYPETACIPQLFEAQVARTPLAIALSFAGQEMSYQTLNERANQLAHLLRQQGVGPEVCVGICLERSFEMVIAIYAILKAGGAYIPLDPTYPPDRLSFMLADAQVPILITHTVVAQERLNRLNASDQPQATQLLCLDAAAALLAQQPTHNPAPSTQDENLAYVIYTSGSTGQPKGAMNRHGAIRNRILWMQEMYGLTPDDRVLQKTPFSFDVSVWEFLWPLLVGARLVIARPEGHKDSAYLVDLIRHEQVTTLHFVPSMLQLFLHEPAVDQCRSLKRVICSGEALPFDLQERFFEHLDAELHNLYGPTEAAVDVTYWPCQSAAADRVVPIGWPIANLQIHLLDSRLNPVPMGVAGELHIGGVGLGRGYLRRPGLTASKFIPNPFSREPGARLYKTGDLARYRPDGTIEYLGRLDFQVKVRGFRIELGEIETALLAHPGLRESLVLARDEEGQHKRLVAYLVPEADPPTVTDLRRFLLDRLPDHMVPATYVFLEAMPLSPNGKVNRKALPEPEQTRPQLNTTFVPPATESETILADIWAKLLGVAQVGRFDNFFELGGDSILSIQVVSRANRAGLHLTPTQVFQHQTIAELAEVAAAAAPLLAEQGIITGPVPLTPIQHWFLAQNLPQPHQFNQAVLLTLQEPVSPILMEQVITHLLRHHDALRLRVHRTAEHTWQQEITDVAEVVPFTMIDLSGTSGAEQLKQMQQHAAAHQARLNFNSGPLLSVVLFQCQPHRADHLLIVIHHLAVDGVSWRILLEDIEVLYRQLASGDTIPQLPLKTSSYRQWAEQLVIYAQTAELQADLPVWQAQQATASGALPTDFPVTPEANRREAVAVVQAALSPEETRALLQDVPAVYNTQMNDVLLAALMQALSSWMGRRTLTIDLEGHGREPLSDAIDLSRTVGWFTTLFPVRLDLSRAFAPGEALKAIKEQLREIPGRGLSYGVLRYLHPDETARKSLQGNAAALVFNYLGQFDQSTADSSLLAFSSLALPGSHSPLNPRTHLLEVNASIHRGQLQMSWAYSQNLYRQATLSHLAEETIKALHTLIHHCQTVESGSFTPSDFPEAALDQDALDALLAEL